MAINLFQRINVTATFAVLSANAFGITRSITSVEPLHEATTAYRFFILNKDALLLAIFSILLRFKTCFDDHYYFGEQYNGPRDYLTLAGFVVGLLSWTTWIISGSLSFNPRYAATWLAITMTYSRSGLGFTSLNSGSCRAHPSLPLRFRLRHQA
jgi:hypothetical protein